MDYLLVGLGNSLNKYTNTYHNIGFLFVSHLANVYSKVWNENKKLSAHTIKLYISAPPANSPKKLAQGKDFCLLTAMPVGFMNQSGSGTLKILTYYELDPAHLIVVHDDSDLSVGNYKISRGGGSAGHKGVQSIIQTIGTDQFWRIRIGIRPPEEINRKKAEEFVLRSISTSHKDILEEVFAKITTKFPQEIFHS